MKFAILVLCLLFSTKHCLAQINVYDTSDSQFSKTNFSFKDDLGKWSYKLRLKKKLLKKSGSLGRVLFYRTELFDNSGKNEFYVNWNAYIQFEIYNIKDSASALEGIRSLKPFNYCEAPDNGGDYFIIGNFLFANEVNCLRCTWNKTDYCRPTVRRIFMNVDKNRISTIREIVSQFQIQNGD